MRQNWGDVLFLQFGSRGTSIPQIIESFNRPESAVMIPRDITRAPKGRELKIPTMTRSSGMHNPMHSILPWKHELGSPRKSHAFGASVGLSMVIATQTRVSPEDFDLSWGYIMTSFLLAYLDV